MPVVSAPHGYNEDQLYVDLRQAFGHPLFLKCRERERRIELPGAVKRLSMRPNG